MTHRDDDAPLRHMLAASQKILRFSKDRTRRDLDTDEQLNLSLVRLLEIIGEAATRVTEPTRSANPEVPWAQIVGMRNRLIHGYDVVDSDILWQTVTADIPALIARLDSISASADTEDA